MKKSKKLMALLIDKEIKDRYAFTCKRLGYKMGIRIEEYMKKDLEKIEKIKQIV